MTDHKNGRPVFTAVILLDDFVLKFYKVVCKYINRRNIGCLPSTLPMASMVHTKMVKPKSAHPLSKMSKSGVVIRKAVDIEYDAFWFLRFLLIQIIGVVGYWQSLLVMISWISIGL